MDFADVNGPQLIAPLVRFGRDLIPDGPAHGVAVHQHFLQRQVAQAPDRGVADVGRQRPSWVYVLEQIGHRIADVHLVPDADAHRRAFLGVDRLAAQVRLIQAHVGYVTAAQASDQERFPSQPRPQEVEPRIVKRANDLAEEHIDPTLALFHNGIDPQRARQAKQQGFGNEEGQKRQNSGHDCDHDFTSRTMRFAWANSGSFTVRT